jgi:hypothetical protein
MPPALEVDEHPGDFVYDTLRHGANPGDWFRF